MTRCRAAIRSLGQSESRSARDATHICKHGLVSPHPRAALHQGRGGQQSYNAHKRTQPPLICLLIHDLRAEHTKMACPRRLVEIGRRVGLALVASQNLSSR